MKAHIRQCQCAQALYPTVFAVQPGRGGSCEEELASVGVGAAVRHREHIPRNKERKKQQEISKKNFLRAHKPCMQAMVKKRKAYGLLCLSLKFSSLNFMP